MSKEARYIFSFFVGSILGVLICIFLIWLDINELSLGLSIKNIIDTFKSQDVYPVSFVIFPLLCGCFSLVLVILAKKNSQITKQQKEIERNSRFASIVKLAEGIGHEFNNPLTIILGQVYLYRELNRPDDVGDICYKRLQIIENEAKKLSGITEKFIALSRSSNYFNPKDIDLNTIAEDISKMKREDLRKANVDLTVRIENGEAIVHVDKKGIIEIAGELIDNAITATMGQDTPKILVKVSRNSEQLIITISDNGHGVEPNIREHIFGPLFTTKDNNESPGLGLFIALKIAEAMSGDIIFSPEEQGATFQLMVPVS